MGSKVNRVKKERGKQVCVMGLMRRKGGKNSEEEERRREVGKKKNRRERLERRKREEMHLGERIAADLLKVRLVERLEVRVKASHCICS
jgi:hypothetical protein